MTQPPDGDATGTPSGPPSGDRVPGPPGTPGQYPPGQVPPQQYPPGQVPPGTAPGQFGNPAQFGGPAQFAAPGGPGSPASGAIPPPPPGYPPYPAPAPVAPKKRRVVLIVSIVAALALLLCGGGGTAAFLTLRNVESGEGAKEPAEAVDAFLTAVYRERDAKKAASHVCAASRDEKKIAAKVAEVRGYAEQHKSPRFSWPSPKVDNQTGDRATVSTKVTMTTSDEKVADQDLRFTVVQKTGWWVCEIN
ncbi:hypothetical protein ACH4OY_22030 [Micromonospora rubida]|uniref:Ig-like domain-containing protein n=1 Tax=Micromonospora rubida TaxID=2697657 RepID=A0ABW7SNP5_9ACTN